MVEDDAKQSTATPNPSKQRIVWATISVVLRLENHGPVKSILLVHGSDLQSNNITFVSI